MGLESARLKRASARPGVRTLYLSVDVPLLVIIGLLVVFGMLVVFSASWDVSFKQSENADHAAMFVHQVELLGLGLGVMTFLALVDYRVWRRWVLPGVIVTLGMLVAAKALGGRNLAENAVQPSELAKLVVVVYLAVWLQAKKEQLGQWQYGLLPLGIIVGVLAAMVMIQPDLSATVTIVGLGILMFWMGGARWRHFLIAALVSAVAAALVLALYTTGSNRMESFLQGLRNPLQGESQVTHALAAIAEGGWLGVGLGQGVGKFAFLSVPHTDSVLAVIGEELGLLGTMAVVLLFAGLLWRGVVIARQAKDELGALLAGGVTLWIMMEATINMLAILGLIPMAGNPLPFFSIGGSNLVVTLAGLGLVLSVSRQSKQDRERSEESAPVRVRRWDRRRRVSRAGRGSTPEA